MVSNISVKSIKHDIQNCSSEELLSLHGIEVHDDGSVYDHTYSVKYRSITEWFNISVSNDDGFEKFSKSYDEEYY